MSVLFILGFYIISTQCVSVFNKSNLFYETSHRPIKECEDIFSTSICLKYEHLCFQNAKVTKNCAKTCKDCPAVSPMACHASQYGCCWDKLTIAGKNNEGCPACKEDAEICSKAQSICYKSYIRRACPITCQVEECYDECADDPEQAEFCPSFKNLGICLLDPPLMTQFCKKTCDLCGKGQIITPNKQIEETKKNTEESEDSLIERIKAEIKKDKEELKTSDEEILEMLASKIKKEVKTSNPQTEEDEDDKILDALIKNTQ